MKMLRSLFSTPDEATCTMSSAAVLDSEPQKLLRQRVSELGPWFHNYEIAKDVWTNSAGAGPGADYPRRRWTRLQPWFETLKGKSCLDVGCSSGFFSLKAMECGAASVLGVDSGEQARAIEQAKFAAHTLGLPAEFRTVSVYDVGQLERTFDVIIFMGVFYHLRHPLLALEALRRICGGTLIFQTITMPSAGRIAALPGVSQDVQPKGSVMLDRRFPSMQFVEGTLGGDPSCWFIPNVEAVAAMLRSSGFTPEEFLFPDENEVLVRCTVSAR
jgi:tRNA (mo5U34)-methyltransferase